MPVFYHPPYKSFFLISDLNRPCFSLKPSLLILTQQTLLKGLSPFAQAALYQPASMPKNQPWTHLIYYNRYCPHVLGRTRDRDHEQLELRLRILTDPHSSQQWAIYPFTQPCLVTRQIWRLLYLLPAYRAID